MPAGSGDPAAADLVIYAWARLTTGPICDTNPEQLDFSTHVVWTWESVSAA